MEKFFKNLRHSDNCPTPDELEYRDLNSRYGKTSDEVIKEFTQRVKILTKESSSAEKFYEINQEYFAKMQKEPWNPEYAILEGSEFVDKDLPVFLSKMAFEKVKVLSKFSPPYLKVRLGEIVDQLTPEQREKALFIRLGDEEPVVVEATQRSHHIVEVYIYY